MVKTELNKDEQIASLKKKLKDQKAYSKQLREQLAKAPLGRVRGGEL